MNESCREDIIHRQRWRIMARAEGWGGWPCSVEDPAPLAMTLLKSRRQQDPESGTIDPELWTRDSLQMNAAGETLKNSPSRFA